MLASVDAASTRNSPSRRLVVALRCVAATPAEGPTPDGVGERAAKTGLRPFGGLAATRLGRAPTCRPAGVEPYRHNRQSPWPMDAPIQTATTTNKIIPVNHHMWSTLQPAPSWQLHTNFGRPTGSEVTRSEGPK